MPLLQILMMLGKEKGILVAETFTRFITLDTTFIPSTFVARKRTGFVVPYAGNDVLDQWKSF